MECTWTEEGADPKTVDTVAERDAVREGKQFRKYSHTCVQCVAKRDSITLHEARRAVKQPRTMNGLARIENFNLALKNIQKDWKFICVDIDVDDAATATSASTTDPLVSSSPSVDAEGWGRERKSSASPAIGRRRRRSGGMQSSS